MSVRSQVEAVFSSVASEQKKALAPLSDDLQLLDSGLDSLSMAIVVARLEDEFGVDPFSAGADEDVEMPLTFGDFVTLYENAGG